MYRTVNCKIFSDPRVRALDANAKLLFLYFLTNSHTHLSGLYYVPWSAIVEETGLNTMEVEESLGHLIESKCPKSGLGLVIWNEECSTIWVVNTFKSQPKGNSHKKSVREHMKGIHSEELKEAFFDYYGDALDGPWTHLTDTVPTPSGEGTGRVYAKEQEKEQEQEKEEEISSSQKILPKKKERKGPEPMGSILSRTDLSFSEPEGELPVAIEITGVDIPREIAEPINQFHSRLGRLMTADEIKAFLRWFHVERAHPSQVLHAIRCTFDREKTPSKPFPYFMGVMKSKKKELGATLKEPWKPEPKEAGGERVAPGRGFEPRAGPDTPRMAEIERQGPLKEKGPPMKKEQIKAGISTVLKAISKKGKNDGSEKSIS